ncbi:MAG: O-methyltransferase [Bacteroidales bacterium]|nr:O-methyltransferase [Bacteroidales bacterium]
MDLFKHPELLDRYLMDHTSPEDPVLAELSRHTYLNEVHPHMLSGHILGSFLQLFSTMISPSRILEIGTYTGYSAICLARGLKPGGRLTTIELNDELRKNTIETFRKAGVVDRIDLVNGNAIEVIPTLKESFDLVFIDAFKEDYPTYYRLVYDKVSSGGYILADNVLWGGKVLNENELDLTTNAIQRFNQIITEDSGVENLLLPIRDGLMVIKKL